MNGDELKAQQTKSVWTNLNPRERVSSRWHARGQEFESSNLRPGALTEDTFSDPRSEKGPGIRVETIYLLAPAAVAAGTSSSAPVVTS